MICSEVITKNKFEEYLKNIMINKVYLERMMQLFDQIKDIHMHEKIMFLLYNEYLSIYDILYDCYDVETGEFDTTAIENIIDAHDDKFKLPYSYIKNDFFRNHVTMLTYENYQSMYNIKKQLDIVYGSLSTDEVIFLEDRFNITQDNFSKLVRLQTSDRDLEISEIEQDSELLRLASALISGIKIYGDEKVENTSDTDEADTLKSVLKKIDLGTIH